MCLDWSKGKDNAGDLKQIEIKNSVISGFEGPVRRFWVKARYIWTSRSQYLFRAEDVSDGCLFDALGRKVVDQISATSVRVNSKARTVSAESGVSAIIYGIDPSQVPVQVSCQKLNYYELNGRAYLSGNVVLRQGDMEIRPTDELEFDRAANQVVIRGGVKCDLPPFHIEADTMTVSLSDHRAVVSGNIRGTRLPVKADASKDVRERQLTQVPTHFKCHQLVYVLNGDRRQVEMSGDVTIYQTSRKLSGDQGIYNQETGDFVMTGHAVFNADSLSWMMDSSRKATVSNKEVVRGMNQPTQVKCHSFYFNSSLKKLKLIGDVVLTQPQLVIKSKQIEYDDSTGWMDLSGYVDIRKGPKLAESVKSSQLSYNIYSERMRMSGAVDTIIELEKKE